MVERTKVIGTQPPPAGWLVLRSGSRIGRDHRLAAETMIGRNAARCDLVLDEVAVSAEHARIRYERRQFILYDLASTNGTFLNGQKIERAALSDGDTVTIGGVRMIFKEVQATQ
jgi:pSer/pThr/pTyr-binding forkhead associated (FHA) protein